MRLLLAVCFAVAMGGSACAEQLNAKGAGTLSCAEYAEAYRKQPDVAEEVFLAWGQGFITGIDIAHDTYDGWYFDLNAKTPDEMKRYVRQYCDTHPLAEYFIGVSEFMKTLPVVHRPKK